MLQKILLTCGIIAPLVYFGTDLLAGKLIKDYSFSAQSMSELGASGSPTRSLVVALTLVASAFMIAFGMGVWQAAGQAILPRIATAASTTQGTDVMIGSQERTMAYSFLLWTMALAIYLLLQSRQEFEFAIGIDG